MEIAFGIAAIALLLGIGRKQWRDDVREALERRRHDRALRKKYDF